MKSLQDGILRTMRYIGSRRQADHLAPEARAELLVQGAVFSESIAHLMRSTFIPKGVYRFRTQDEANEHELAFLAQGMAELAARRSVPEQY